MASTRKGPFRPGSVGLAGVIAANLGQLSFCSVGRAQGQLWYWCTNLGSIRLLCAANNLKISLRGLSKEVIDVVFELKTVTDDDRPIYLSGTFNDWVLADPEYAFQRLADGRYRYRLRTAGSFPLYYSYHRGNWDQEELDEWGNKTPNRRLRKGASHVQDVVPRWRWNGLACRAELMPQKFIIEDDFEIPQLGKRRRVWALVPCDYYARRRRYPVLYLQDAQNLFSEHAPFGNWAIDQRLAILKEQGYGDIIIIAIEHGGHDRIREYSPFDTAEFGPGEGALYSRFITQTLKPYVDNKFRSNSHRLHTGIGGSSMGGLISVYTAMRYPQIFSKWMIFSPSLWLSSEIFTTAQQFTNEPPTHVYLYGGQSESRAMEADLRRFTDVLREKASNKQLFHYHLSIHPQATHNERFWGMEFPRALKWLYFDTN